jgi:putative DNA methylase
MTVISPKKLIEVALPLDAINVECTRRKRKAPAGYPTAFHKWWAQRPVAAARAVIFAQLVNDPEDLWRCQNPGIEPNQQHRGHWTKARAKLFKIIEDLILWDNTTNETVLNSAREVIRQSWRDSCDLNKGHPLAKELFDPEKMPSLHDPFAGSGTIPLEAQRLGLKSSASDLNPVAVVINKAMIEIPPKFVGRAPVCPQAKKSLMVWTRVTGLAEDVRRYAQWMRNEAFRRIGPLFPPIEITSEMVEQRPDLAPYKGEKLGVVAWLWARTVKSPNPAYSNIDVPLASTFVLSNKAGKEAYVEPVIDKGGYTFTVRVGKPPSEAKSGTTAGKRAAFLCLMSKVPMSYDYIRDEGQGGRMGQKLMAIVAEGTRGRVYLSPTPEQETMAGKANPVWRPENKLPDNPRDFKTPNYGITTFGELFTPRQLMALTTFSDLLGEARERVLRDAISAGLPDDNVPLEADGTGALAYADAVSVHLWSILARVLHYSSTNCAWLPKDSAIARTFTKQALPMTWDYAEGNVFEKCSTEWDQCCQVVTCCIEYLSGQTRAIALQADAASLHLTEKPFISTDPPYYDNVGYADLSDFFYVWMRRSLRSVYPNLLATIAVPKAEELVATPYRHGNKDKAEKFFLDGMTRAMHNLAVQAHPAAPLTIYYAFKQSETESDGTNSTGWETFLEAVLKSGLAITGTWPMRTEGDNRQIGLGTNALASSIVMVCRPRAADAGTISRRQFVRQLNEALPLALDAMTRESEGLLSPVAPVDLSQAIIGPGMAIFSRYEAVLEADGTPMTVRTALQLINRFLAEDDFDADTQFCLHWFEQHGWETGKFGEADTLARAKGTAVAGVQSTGVIEAGGGNVRLLRWKEYQGGWDPTSDSRIPVWKALHQLIRAYSTDGDSGAARLLAGVAAKAEASRQLAYRLYTLSERANRAEDARAYNEVVTGWSGIESAAARLPTPQQRSLFDDEESP